ncbi:HU family DNA-binding protein [Wenyingzhuangia sp. IMCC45574]
MLKVISVQKINPQDRAADKKFYLQTISKDLVDIDRMATLIARQSTVSEIDCKAVITALAVHTIDQLEQGRTVHLGEMGTFKVGVSSEGVASEEEVSVDQIVKRRLNFRASPRMKKMLATVKSQLAS